MEHTIKKLFRFNMPFMATAIIVSSCLNLLLFRHDSGMLFILLPGLLWGAILCIPVLRYLEDARHSATLFVSCIFILWLIVLLAGALSGWLLFTLSPFFALPFLGAFSALASYVIYSRVVLNHFSYKHAVICFCLGYIAFLLYPITSPANKSFATGYAFHFFYWQLLAGAGHMLAYVDKQANRDEK